MDLKSQVFDVFEELGLSKDRIRFIYVYGSYLQDQSSAGDIDICVSVESDNLERLEQRISGRVVDKLHVSIFENLPLQVRREVFKGELLYKRDKQVYDDALQTFREYDRFKPLYETSIGA